MKTAGVREARQNLSKLLRTIERGREILITEHGRPVARLVPPGARKRAPYRSHGAFRAKLSIERQEMQPILEAERDDRF